MPGATGIEVPHSALGTMKFWLVAANSRPAVALNRWLLVVVAVVVVANAVHASKARTAKVNMTCTQYSSSQCQPVGTCALQATLLDIRQSLPRMCNPKSV